MRQLRLLPLLLTTALLIACSRGPASLPPDQRPVTSALPAAERAQLRHLPVAGAPNFRDLGGYLTTDNRTVKWGKLYRTDALDKLSDDDQRYLERLHIDRIVDFRVADEAAQAPDRLPADLAKNYLAMPVGFSGQNYNKFVKQLMSGDTKDLHLDRMLSDTNRRFVLESSPIFRTWLHGLLETDGAQVFHCTAGKDRTGFAAAIFLLSLGVPQTTVMQDYLASNHYLEDKNRRSLWEMRIFSLFRADTDGVQQLMGVDPRYLQAAFDAMTEKYGSVDNYLREALGVDDDFRAQLRARYLEPVAG
jgi:protein-tyrosine phosphatase